MDCVYIPLCKNGTHRHPGWSWSKKKTGVQASFTLPKNMTYIAKPQQRQKFHFLFLPKFIGKPPSAVFCVLILKRTHPCVGKLERIICGFFAFFQKMIFFQFHVLRSIATRSSFFVFHSSGSILIFRRTQLRTSWLNDEILLEAEYTA